MKRDEDEHHGAEVELQSYKAKLSSNRSWGSVLRTVRAEQILPADYSLALTASSFFGLVLHLCRVEWILFPASVMDCIRIYAIAILTWD